MKTCIPTGQMIPRYRTLKFQSPKYRNWEKKRSIPQYRKPQCPPFNSVFEWCLKKLFKSRVFEESGRASEEREMGAVMGKRTKQFHLDSPLSVYFSRTTLKGALHSGLSSTILSRHFLLILDILSCQPRGNHDQTRIFP